MFGLRLRLRMVRAVRLRMAAVTRCLCLPTAVAGLPLRPTVERHLTAVVAVVPCLCRLTVVDERQRLVEAEQLHLMEEAVGPWAAVAGTQPQAVEVTAAAVAEATAAIAKSKVDTIPSKNAAFVRRFSFL
jgi:hypothetical protein